MNKGSDLQNADVQKLAIQERRDVNASLFLQPCFFADNP
jgi:hypothetical protein